MVSFYRILIDKIKRYVIFLQKKYPGVNYNMSTTIGDLSVFEGLNSIGDRSFFKGRMGVGSYMGANCYLEANVGRFTSIASDVKCNLGTHPYKRPYVSTSPMFYSLRKQTGETFARKQLFDEVKAPVEIGHDCWVGQYVFLVGGIKINNGAVILAGSIVTKDVPPYAIVAGVPAKVVGYRYEEHIITKLQQYQWWNMPIEWLRENYEMFSDIDKFLKTMERECVK